MLGHVVSDPEGIEASAGDTPGLGLLDIQTTMGGDKSLRDVQAKHVNSGVDFNGYEIHIGQTTGPDCDRPFAQIGHRADGAMSSDGIVSGSYVHGMFSDDAFRRAFLRDLGAQASDLNYDAQVDQTLDDLAAHLEQHLDVDGLLGLAR